jgi:spore germination cell wall hydrolase CwlJ-like protein
MNWYKQAKLSNEIILQAGLMNTIPLWLSGILLSIMAVSGVTNLAEKIQKYKEDNKTLSQQQKETLDAISRDKEFLRQIQSDKEAFSKGQQGSVVENPMQPKPNQPTQTKEKLESDKPTQPTQTPQTPVKSVRLTKEQTNVADALARTLWGEARGEGWEGIEAVASVIWNRTNGNPSRLDDVVKQKKQFSIWNSGIPEKGQGELWNKIVNLSKRMATNQFQPKIPYTHYFNPDKATPNWAYPNGRLPKDHQVIGNHVFLSVK